MSIESGFFDQNPRNCARKIFSKNWHFQTWDIKKPRQFYENVLIETNSVSFKDYFLKDNPSFITHSTAMINKVLQPSQWMEGDPNKYVKFTASILTTTNHATCYNYWDYKQAWFNVFFTQNAHFRHSWMIYWNTGAKIDFPIWFVSWWLWFGPVQDILPKQILELYEFFEQNLTKNPKQVMFPPLLKFFATFALAWIAAWDYDTIDNPHTGTPDLIRRFKTKWWDKFKADQKVSKQAILNWFKQNPDQGLLPKTDEKEHGQFLAQKSKIQALLAEAKTEDEYFKIMRDLIDHSNNASKESSTYSLNDAVDLADDNEDDCYGILPPIKR